MDEQNRNLILATALSFLVILIWFILFPPEEPVPPQDVAPATAEGTVQPAVPGAEANPTLPGTSEAGVPGSGQGATAAPEAPAAPRVEIQTNRLSGSISLAGGRIDTLNLSDYRETIDPGADTVTLLVPEGQNRAYYALFGWSPGAGLDAGAVPGASTPWSQSGDGALTTGNDLLLTWDNGAGLSFQRRISVDDDFMFTVTQSVTNNSGAPVRLAPYGVIARHGEPDDLKGFFIIQEGPIRQTGEQLDEYGYDDLRDFDADPRWGPASDVVQVEQNGWIGFTDHYWMTTLIPDTAEPFQAALQYDAARDIYRTTALLSTRDVAPGATVEVTQRLFAGAKEWETIREYEEAKGIYRFIDSIDWGWFFFLTKPIFAVLHWLNGVIGNMGWAIIALTFIIKALLLPLAYKSYVSMARMKELQPEMEKIKERAGDDRQKLQQEMMGLYKKEKVNPAAGCLPILLQIPIFFSLYKVIFVTIELRHAPWIGWIRDLSAPDPSSLFNLWGVLPWAGPEPGSILALIFIGILPLILGISMWLQQKLNPAPTDPTQAMIFAWMPWVFMFMLGSFASGLVIYWIANNTITFMQQYAIMRSQGMKPDVFGNITSGFRKKPGGTEKTAANKTSKPDKK
ncbi:membrane protein insertase YidC [Ovoidimarina sediminis]|uniref:membrane protein insertase YidC n=1 Tax=Ovoidimarina sediminis TaxID=3079856 RepID=UPI002914B074|nr:membrane protein insertase YidC [Rhodophyticola sp. MJ-SS7]MDU8946320.1 membrane protein insertase YidC [Rhodophyticola sp. MJ-SS7]